MLDDAAATVVSSLGDVKNTSVNRSSSLRLPLPFFAGVGAVADDVEVEAGAAVDAAAFAGDDVIEVDDVLVAADVTPVLLVVRDGVPPVDKDVERVVNDDNDDGGAERFESLPMLAVFTTGASAGSASSVSST